MASSELRVPTRYDTPTALSIPALLQNSARRTPDAPALLAVRRATLSFAQLRDECERVGASLSAMGVGQRDRVGVVMPNGPEIAVAFLSIASVATCAPLNPALRRPEFDNCIADLGLTTIVVAQGLNSPVVEVARDRGVQIVEVRVDPGGPAGLLRLQTSDPRPAATRVSARPEDIALVLQTSGTTSRPKRVPLTHFNICRSAISIKRTLALDVGDRCFNVMPLFHVHGLIGALLSSLSASSSVVCAPDFQSPEFFGWLQEFEPTWYTAVPSMHQSVLARAGERKRPIASSLRFVRSCSAALPPQLLNELESLFGVPVIEAYGMTEAAHQIASNPLSRKPRKIGSVGLPTGPDVAILDSAGASLPPGVLGEISIRGDGVTVGYEDDPAANASAFSNGWLRTGDQGYRDDDGYLFIVGRLKEMINRGGEKIWPAEIESVLLAHPAIAQAVSFSVPDVRLGEEVGAAVVVRPGASVGKADILDFAAARLADFKLPRHLVIVADIPKGPTGKLQRVGLAQTLGLVSDVVPRRGAQRVPPRNEVERRLVAIWRDVLKHDAIGVHDNFLDVGGDSVLATMVVTRIRDVFGVDVLLRDVFESATVAQLAAVVERPTESSPSTTSAETQIAAEAIPLVSDR